MELVRELVLILERWRSGRGSECSVAGCPSSVCHPCALLTCAGLCPPSDPSHRRSSSSFKKYAL